MLPVWFLEPSVLSGCSMPKAMQRKLQGGPSAFFNILRQKTTLVFRWEGDWHQCSQVIRILDTLTVGTAGEKHNVYWSLVIRYASSTVLGPEQQPCELSDTIPLPRWGWTLRPSSDISILARWAPGDRSLALQHYLPSTKALSSLWYHRVRY